MLCEAVLKRPQAGSASRVGALCARFRTHGRSLQRVDGAHYNSPACVLFQHHTRLDDVKGVVTANAMAPRSSRVAPCGVWCPHLSLAPKTLETLVHWELRHGVGPSLVSAEGSARMRLTKMHRSDAPGRPCSRARRHSA